MFFYNSISFFFYVVLSFITNSKNDNVNILLKLIFFIDIIPFENYLFVYLYKKIKLFIHFINNNSYSIETRGHAQVVIIVIIFLESRHA